MQHDLNSVLVTGGAGFIGSHLCEALVSQGVQLTIVDNFSGGTQQNLAAIADRAKILELDVCSAAFKKLLMNTSFDVIFHLAANAYVPPSVDDPSFDFQNNLVASFQLLETLRRSGSKAILIYASSAAVYGNPIQIPISEGDVTLPISPYGVSKLAIERYVSVFAQLYGLRAASMRFFSVYGPRQHKQIIYDIVKKISDNPREIEILGDGTQVRDMIYVGDVISAILTALKFGSLEGEVYNVAGGQGLTILELVETTAKHMGYRPNYTYTGNVRPGDADRWIADIDRLRKLGFTPSCTLAEGIKRTVEWYSSLK